MSTEFFNEDSVTAIQFYGGDNRGLVVQITTKEGFVSLTFPTFKKLIVAAFKFYFRG